MPTYKKESTLSERLKRITIPAGLKVQVPETTLLQRLVKRLLKVIRLFDPPQEPSLLGRIHELKSHADEYHRQLESIKNQFDKEHDPEAYTFIEAIIEPLLKEVGAIQKALLVGNVAQQAKVFKKYGEWIDRARIWIHFHARVTHKQEMIDAVVHHLIGAALTCIDRDRQVIQDYQVHQLASLGITPEVRQHLATELQADVQVYLDLLKALKQRPQVISLEELGKWKSQIDECRQIYFEKALHLIDALVEREAPLSYSVEANEHLFDAISETTYLEREAAELQLEVEEGNLSDQAQRNMLCDHLAALAEEVHRLCLDLRLGWDLIARLQEVGATIAATQALLAQKYRS